MKKAFVLVCILLQFGQIKAQNSIAYSQAEVRIDEASNLTIRGTTNVNKFECALNEALPDDKLKVSFIRTKGGFDFESGAIKVPVSIFDCGNKWITKDFKSMLSKDGASEVVINLISLKGNGAESLIGAFDIKMATGSNNYTIPLHFENEEEFLILEGTKEMQLTDFNLDPPVKMAGMIKVHNTVVVHFYLKFLK